MTSPTRYTATRDNANVIVTEHTESGSVRTVAIFHTGYHMVRHGNQLLEIRPGFGQPYCATTLINDPEHDAVEILNAIAATYPHDTRFLKRCLKKLAYATAGFVFASLLFVWSDSPRSFSLPQQVSRMAEAGVPQQEPVKQNPSRYPAPVLQPAQEKPALQTGQIRGEPSAGQKSTVRVSAGRHQMAAVLKHTAEKDMFTVNLSAGHERTLYAFLDPACVNCRTLEPALTRLSGEFNVVVYPVSVIGGEQSASQIAPLLCEPDVKKRQEGWHRLYAADAGMIVPGTETGPEQADCLKAAAAAIDVNNLAFRQFGFKGTPWVLTDTGYHLPTDLLKESGTVRLFLKTSDALEQENSHE